MKFLSGFFLRKLHLFILAKVLVGVYFALEDYEAKIASMEKQETDLEKTVEVIKKKIEQAKEFEKNLEISKARVQQVAVQIEDVQKKLPDTTNDTEILDSFSKIAGSLNIKDVSQNPYKENLEGFYFTKQYQFRAVGTFLQFLIFFENLGAQERIYNMKTLRLKMSDDASKGRFKLLDIQTTLEAFRYNPEHKESTGLDEINEKYKR